MRTVNPAVQAFYGPYTKHVSALAAVSPTFADEVIAHDTYAAICDAILLPSCSRYQLNLGHLIARGPGAEAQFAHRDEDVWPHFPRPHDELQVASLVALDRLPGRHRRNSGRAREQSLAARPAPAARRRRRRGGAARRRGDLPRLHHPLRRAPTPPPTSGGSAPTSASPSGGCAPRRTTRSRSRPRWRARCRPAPRSCSATRCTTPSPTAAATSAWSASATRWSSSPNDEL